MSPLQSLYVQKLSHIQLQTYQLFSHWKDIVGEEVASLLEPAKTTYNPRKKQEILYVRPLKEGTGFFFQYQKEALLSSINEYFGHPIFAHIQLTSSVKRINKMQKILSSHEAVTHHLKKNIPEDIKEKLTTVKDETLRLKLKKFYNSLDETKNQ
jgi:hypothetical protein